MVLIKTYKGRHSEKTSHTVKVYHNNKLLKSYYNISTQAMNTVIADLSHHAIIEHVNVLSVKELRQ